MRDVSTGRARPHPKVGARRPHPEVAGSEATSEPTAIYRGGFLTRCKVGPSEVDLWGLMFP